MTQTPQYMIDAVVVAALGANQEEQQNRLLDRLIIRMQEMGMTQQPQQNTSDSSPTELETENQIIHSHSRLNGKVG